MIPVVVNVSEEEAARLEKHAQNAGYKTVADYVRALIDEDMEAAPINDNPDEAYILASIKQSAKEAFSGITVPLETLWEDDD